MRLWHKDLIPVLPDKQLLGQWRECCAIAKNIATKGTPNHLLVNKIIEYPMDHFYTYAMLVADEMIDRGYNVEIKKFAQYLPDINSIINFHRISHEMLFANWHNNRYFRQCCNNLEEKFDCGGIKEDDWKAISMYVKWVNRN